MKMCRAWRPTSLPTPQAGPTPAPLLTEENAAFVIDLLADRPVYSQPRFEDRAAESPAYDPPVYEVPLIDPPVYEIPLVDASAPVLVEIPVSEPTAPRPFVAPEAWPAPHRVVNAANAPAPSPVPAAVAAEAGEDIAEAPVLARVTPLPTRERLARESYLLKSRELERAARERLRYEQERLEARIREQLEADRRQLAGKLDELLEDTVMLPRTVNES